MKIRSDFVTNSSSSSFVCDFCGYETSGMDMCLSEAGMCECENGHTICTDHLENMDWLEIVKKLISNDIVYNEDMKKKYPKDEQYYENRNIKSRKLLEELPENDEDDLKTIANNYDFESSVPAEHCPLCNFTDVTSDDMENYLLAKNKQSHKEILDEIRSNFNSYDEFLKYCRGN
jgi:hypothetical protein